MTLTLERANLITEFLSADTERAKRVVVLEPSKAMEEINAYGNDFTLDEINEYGNALKSAAASGELDAESLDHVAGGDASITGATILVAAATIVGGAVCGLISRYGW